MKFFGPPRPERVLLRRNTLQTFSAKSHAALRARASFLVQGFVLCPFLKSGTAPIALMRFTLFEQRLAVEAFCPEFFCGAVCTWRI